MSIENHSKPGPESDKNLKKELSVLETPYLLTGTEQEKMLKLEEYFLQYKDKATNEIKSGFILEYQDFVKKVLGRKDLDGEYFDLGLDPYSAVAGETFSKMYLRENKNFDGSDAIFTPRTVLTDLDHTDKYRIYKSKKVPGLEIIKNFFSRINLVEDEEFGNIDTTFGFYNANFSGEPFKNNKKIIPMGAVGIDHKVLEESQNHPKEFNPVLDRLSQMSIWFNHDMLSHGSFLPNQNLDRSLNRLQDGDPGHEYYQAFGDQNFEYGKKNEDGERDRVFAGELWSMSFQADILNEIERRRPAVGKFLRMHLNSFLRDVDVLAESIQDKKYGKIISEYYKKLYSFMFFRIVNPKVFFQSNVEGNERIKNNREVLENLPDYELSTRESLHGAKGLRVAKEDGYFDYVPHRVFLQTMDSSMEDGEFIMKKVASFKDNGKPDEETLIFIRSNEENMKKWVDAIFNYIFLQEFKGFDHISHISKDSPETLKLVSSFAQGEIKFDDIKKRLNELGLKNKILEDRFFRERKKERGADD